MISEEEEGVSAVKGKIDLINEKTLKLISEHVESSQKEASEREKVKLEKKHALLIAEFFELEEKKEKDNLLFSLLYSDDK